MVLLFLPHNHIQSQKENIYLPGARQILSFLYATSNVGHIQAIIKTGQKRSGTKMRIFFHYHNTILLKTKKKLLPFHRHKEYQSLQCHLTVEGAGCFPISLFKCIDTQKVQILETQNHNERWKQPTFPLQYPSNSSMTCHCCIQDTSLNHFLQ